MTNSDIIALIFALVSIGAGLVFNDPRIAKGSFITASLIALAGGMFWIGRLDTISSEWRAACDIFLLIGVGVGLLVLLRYVDSKNIVPNLQCIGDEDIFAELTKREIFVETEHFDKYRLVTSAFQNLPRPPQKTAEIDKVEASVYFYNTDFPDEEYVDAKVLRACWLNEPDKQVSFGVGDVHYVVCAVFEANDGDASGYKPKIEFYGHPQDSSKSLERFTWSTPQQRFLARVRLKAGKHGEYGGEFDYELDFQGGGFTWEYLSKKKKQERRESNLAYLRSRVEQGQALLEEYAGKYETSLNERIHRWTNETAGYIRRNFGLPRSSTFDSASKKKNYWPAESPDKGEHSIINDHYTRLESLRDLLAEVIRERDTNLGRLSRFLRYFRPSWH